MDKVYKHYLIEKYVKPNSWFGVEKIKYEIVKEEIDYLELDKIVNYLIKRGRVSIKKIYFEDMFCIQFELFSYDIYCLLFTDEARRNSTFERLTEHCWFRL